MASVNLLETLQKQWDWHNIVESHRIAKRNKIPEPRERLHILKLPDEIINEIFSFAVGRRILHVNHAETVMTLHVKKLRKRCCPHKDLCLLGQGPEFYIHTCEATVSEQAALKEFHSGADIIDDNDDEEFYVADARRRYQRCRVWEQPYFDCRTRLPSENDFTDAFVVCRRLYHFAFQSFWKTNTLTFVETTSFGFFMSRLLPHQRQLLRLIDIVVPKYHCPQPTDFNPHLLKDIEKLEDLKLAVHGATFDDRLNFFAEEDHWVGDVDARKTPAGEILRLEVVDIKNISVIVYDNEYDYQYNPTMHEDDSDRFDIRYTVGEKQELADFMHQVLSSSTAERQMLALREQRINEVENLLKGLKYAQDINWQLQRNRFLTHLYTGYAGLDWQVPSGKEL
ncbi:MAG: hypothetical protein Q9218_005105 [Villophora microphyllina]